jgi:hypothetical protein
MQYFELYLVFGFRARLLGKSAGQVCRARFPGKDAGQGYMHAMAQYAEQLKAWWNWSKMQNFEQIRRNKNKNNKNNNNNNTVVLKRTNAGKNEKIYTKEWIHSVWADAQCVEMLSSCMAVVKRQVGKESIF